MAREFKRIGIRNTIVIATGTAPIELIPAASGYTISLTSSIAASRGPLDTVSLWAGNTKVTPTKTIPVSGTAFIDDWGGKQYELPTGSGLFARLGGESAGAEMEIQTFYLSHDDRTPITKPAARAATYTNITVSRAGG